MSADEAFNILPADAKWSSSFGNPGEGGYSSYYRTPIGERWIISNGPWNGPTDWQCTKAPEPSPNVVRSLERHRRIFGA